MDLLDNEGVKNENHGTVVTFIVLFMIIAVACIFSCYLNYTFSSTLARDVFYMFIGSFLADLLVFRVIIALLLSLIAYCKAKKDGYIQEEYLETREEEENFMKA